MGSLNTVNEGGQAFNNYQQRYHDAMEAKKAAKRQREGPGAKAARFLKKVSDKYPAPDQTTRMKKYKNQ